MKTLGDLALLALISLASLRAADPSPIKPNILHIHADDHCPDGLHALGTPLLQTPNLDSLVDRGMTFTHCYTRGSMTGAACAPSRTMMLTGRSRQRIPGAPGAAPNAANPSTFLPRVIEAAGVRNKQWDYDQRVEEMSKEKTVPKGTTPQTSPRTAVTLP